MVSLPLVPRTRLIFNRRTLCGHRRPVLGRVPVWQPVTIKSYESGKRVDEGQAGLRLGVRLKSKNPRKRRLEVLTHRERNPGTAMLWTDRHVGPVSPSRRWTRLVQGAFLEGWEACASSSRAHLRPDEQRLPQRPTWRTPALQPGRGEGVSAGTFGVTLSYSEGGVSTCSLRTACSGICWPSPGDGARLPVGACSRVLAPR